MKVGFIGLGNVGGKLCGSLLRNGFDLTVRDLDKDVAQPFLDKGAHWAESPKAMAEVVDIVITCLPSPAASARVQMPASAKRAPCTVRCGMGKGRRGSSSTGRGGSCAPSHC